MIRLTNDPTPAGYVVLRPFTWDDQISGTELGYIIDKGYWGKGLASQASAAAVNYARYGLKLDRLFALVGNKNQASIRAVQNMRFNKLPLRPAQHPDNSIWELEL